MKSTLFLALVFVFLVAPTAAFAANYNLQPYTSCGLTDCVVKVNLATLGLTTNKINALKAINLTNFVNKAVGATLNNIAYSWNGTELTFTANIPAYTKNYFNIGYGGDTLDPWFNSTLTLTASLNDGSSSGSETLKVGANLTALANVNIIAIKKDSACDAITCYVHFLNNTLVKTGLFSGDWCNFTQPIYANQRYYVSMDKNTSSFTNRYVAAGGYPSQNAHINITAGAYYSGGWAGDGYKRCLKSITTQQSTATYYELHLAIDGAEANATTECGAGTHNYTAWANLTALPISLMAQDSIWNTSTTSVSYYTALAAVGEYNISANASNASTSAMKWLYHTITPGSTTALMDFNETEETTFENPYTLCNDTMTIAYVSTPVEPATGELILYTNGLDVYAITLDESLEGEQPIYGNDTSIFYDGLGVYNISIVREADDCYNTAEDMEYINLTYCPAEPETPTDNITYTISVDLNNAPMVCINETHALRYTTINSQEFSETYLCPYGCEDNSCNAEPIAEGLYTFLFIIAFFVIILFFDKFILRR